ncbi:unnamed protein product, partial [marine sediment metagenome]
MKSKKCYLIFLGLYLTALLATLFFTHVTLQIPRFLKSLTNGVFDDLLSHFIWGLDPITIFGDVILILILITAVKGIVRKRYYASVISAVVYFTPTLFVFVVRMTILFTGLEILGFLIAYIFRGWGIVEQFLFMLFSSGQVFLVPYWIAITAYASEGGDIWANIEQVRDVYGSIFIIVGLLVLFLGVAAWLNTKYQGRRLVDSG